jgi:flagellar basal-body rod protein FlgC
MLNILKTNESGLAAQRRRMDVISGNIANAQTTRQDGKPDAYQRRLVEFTAVPNGNSTTVAAKVVLDEATPFSIRNEPGHPDADKDGNVRYPNINLMNEFVDAIAASRAFDANVNAMQMNYEMAEQALQLLRK